MSSANALFTSHPRGFEANRYVYPVLSRRAGGISIGVHLSLDLACNFRCVYCQGDRSQPAKSEAIDLVRLADELGRMVEAVLSGSLFEGARFRDVPAALRRLNDIALSGDGEPTAYAQFDRVVDLCAEVRRRRNLDDVNIVLLTNATLLHRPQVRRALAVLDANGGEIWAKLDAGTEAYYRRVNRSAVPWRQILDNLQEAAKARPLVIQSLFSRIDDRPPPPEEIEAYCGRLEEIIASGGQIRLVQIHTVAREPVESWVKPLAPDEIDALVERVRRRTGLTVAGFYGKTKSGEWGVES